MALAVKQVELNSTLQPRVQTESRPLPLPALTGLRFLAAILVVLHHIVRLFRPGVLPTHEGIFTPVLRSVYGILYMGNTAVSFFFVLSGFILAYSYVGREGRMRTTSHSYYISRIARVYPIYFLAFLLAAAPFFWHHPNLSLPSLLAALVAALTLTQTWWQLFGLSLGYTWNGPGWSLSVEAFFYLLFPVLVLLIGRLRTRALLLASISVWVSGMVIPSVLMRSSCGSHIAAIACADIVDTLPLLRLPEFVLGMIAGILFVRHMATRTRWIVLPPGLALAGTALVLLMQFAYPHLQVAPVALAPCWLAIIVSCAGNSKGAASLLASRPLARLGEASYALYLLHWPIWEWMTRLTSVPMQTPAANDSASMLRCVVYVGASVCISLISLRFVEEPARRAWHSLDRGRASVLVLNTTTTQSVTFRKV